MSSAAPLPPSSCLAAIVLTVKSGSGPRIVFHYPAFPSVHSSSSSRDPSWYGTPGTLSDHSDSSHSGSSTDSDSGLTGEDERSSRAGSRSSAGRGSSRRDATVSGRSGLGRHRGAGPAGLNEDVDEDMPERRKNHREPLKQSRRKDSDFDHRHHHDEPEWEHILGFTSEGLSKLLSPGRSFNKRRFELSIDQLVFLGTPRFVREDGKWKKKRRPKRRDHSKEPDDRLRRTSSVPDLANGSVRPSRTASMSSMGGARTKSKSAQNSYVDYEQIPIYGPAYGHGMMSGAASEAGSESRSTSTTENSSASDLSMFNVVFVLTPPALEYHTRVDEIYDNVVKKFAKALKYAQAYRDFVHLESKAIWAMKEKAKENHIPISTLWASIAKNSALARAMMITFNTISQDKIAHINLGPRLDASFQIPQAVSISAVPTPTDPQMPGLWLTTATPWEDDDSDTLSPHSALLLLEDDDVLLKEVEGDAKELSGPLAYFVRNLTPEKSLMKISKKSSLTITDVQVLARHLIYWRRGRAIPPLRERDTYIVSPNADMRSLKTATVEFAAKFPTLPSLPIFLNSLSTGTPRPWHYLLPSRDHRSIYIKILAWLLRHGWVTQLRTFGWIRVSHEVKVAVAAKRDQEKRHARSTERTSVSSPYSMASDRGLDLLNIERASSISPFRRERNVDSSASPILTASDTASVSSGRTAVTVVPPFSPQPRHHPQRPTSLSMRHSPLQDNTSVSGEQDSPLAPTSQPRLESPIDHSDIPAVALNGSGPAGNGPHDSAFYQPSIIQAPHKATATELRWIDHIGASFEDAETKEHWPILLKYFDGKHAFEDIHVREGLKNKKVAAILLRLSTAGWLVTVKHW